MFLFQPVEVSSVGQVMLKMYSTDWVQVNRDFKLKSLSPCRCFNLMLLLVHPTCYFVSGVHVS